MFSSVVDGGGFYNGLTVSKWFQEGEGKSSRSNDNILQMLVLMLF